MEALSTAVILTSKAVDYSLNQGWVKKGFHCEGENKAQLVSKASGVDPALTT